MEHLANLFLTLTLTLPNSGIGITWFFSSPGCEGCILHQIATMEKFYREVDEVVITTGDIDEEARALAERIGRRFPQATPSFWKWCACADPAMVTGFQIEDRFSGEFLSYNARQGNYNPMRAQNLLAVYRDPSPSKPP